MLTFRLHISLQLFLASTLLQTACETCLSPAWEKFLGWITKLLNSITVGSGVNGSNIQQRNNGHMDGTSVSCSPESVPLTTSDEAGVLFIHNTRCDCLFGVPGHDQLRRGQSHQAGGSMRSAGLQSCDIYTLYVCLSVSTETEKSLWVRTQVEQAGVDLAASLWTKTWCHKGFHCYHLRRFFSDILVVIRSLNQSIPARFIRLEGFSELFDLGGSMCTKMNRKGLKLGQLNSK